MRVLTNACHGFGRQGAVLAQGIPLRSAQLRVTAID